MSVATAIWLLQVVHEGELEFSQCSSAFFLPLIKIHIDQFSHINHNTDIQNTMQSHMNDLFVRGNPLVNVEFLPLTWERNHILICLPPPPPEHIFASISFPVFLSFEFSCFCSIFWGERKFGLCERMKLNETVEKMIFSLLTAILNVKISPHFYQRHLLRNTNFFKSQNTVNSIFISPNHHSHSLCSLKEQ
jgi:hypothetical protein